MKSAMFIANIHLVLSVRLPQFFGIMRDGGLLIHSLTSLHHLIVLLSRSKQLFQLQKLLSKGRPNLIQKKKKKRFKESVFALFVCFCFVLFSVKKLKVKPKEQQKMDR